MNMSNIKYIKKNLRNAGLVFLAAFAFQANVLAQESAIVDFASQEKGILIPRMNTQQRMDINSPDEGLIVYDLEKHTFYYFNGTAWKTGTSVGVSPSSDSFWTFDGVDNSKFQSGTPFLGTTEADPLIFKTNNTERFRITENGIWHFENKQLNAETSSILASSLNVKNNVQLNTSSGVTTINGQTVIGGPAENPTTLTGNTRVNKDLDVLGDINLRNNLSVDGVALINNFFTVTKRLNAEDLTVQKDVLLNSDNGNTLINGALVVGGPLENTATFKGPVVMDKSLEVSDMIIRNTLKVGGASTLDGTLVVDKEVDFKSTLNVDGATDFNNTMTVDGATNLNSTLDVDGASRLRNNLRVDGATDLNATLDVAGITRLRSNVTADQSVAVGGNMTVTGTTSLNNTLNVTKNASSFISTFSNTNTGQGDGIRIKLGKPKSSYLYPGTKSSIETIVNNGITQTEVNNFKKLFRDDIPIGDKGVILAKLVVDSYTLQYRVIAGLAVSVGNLITGFLNDELGLPIPIGPVITPAINFPAINVSGFEVDVPVIPTFTLPGFQVTGGFQILGPIEILPKFDIVPKIPEIDLSIFGVPKFDVLSPDFWGVPKLFFTELVSGGVVDNNNLFMQFADKSGSPMGNIRGESILNWVDNFLNPAWLAGLKDAVQGSPLDPVHAKFHWQNYIWDAMIKYLKVGVEYTSGNGDYAEWLERVDEKEFISQGEIVGVIGGKISKNLDKAEQVMVVSHNPIVLGNVPPEGKMNLGNNVAFMGQVPVKIIGPVASGDYILGNDKTPGYGIAKSPEEMEVEDFHIAVGRSWESNKSKLPMMANTVIGVHNGGFINVLKKYDEQFKASNERFKNLESQLNLIMSKLENEKK